MAAFALGVVVAPIAGPTLGGWLTDNLTWRWAFYINIPVGVLAILMIHAFVDDPPYIRNARRGKVDTIGFGLMAIALGTLQIILDKGQEDDWFSAAWIWWFTAVSLVSIIAFIVWELRNSEPIVQLRVLRNRNFVVGTLLISLVGVVLYSAITLIPLYLQTLMGYTALQSGMAVGTRGIGALISMPIVGYLTGKMDYRKIIGSGFLLVAASLWLIGDLNLEIPMHHIALPSIMTGVGLAMMFVPLATVAMGTLPQIQMGNASGIFNLMRNIGGSVGIALLTTYLTRRTQANQSVLVSYLTPWDPNYNQRIHEIQNYLGIHLTQVETYRQAQFLIYDLVRQQSKLLAFVQSFRMLAVISVICIAATLLLKKVRGSRRNLEPTPSPVKK